MIHLSKPVRYAAGVKSNEINDADGGNRTERPNLKTRKLFILRFSEYAENA